MASEEGTPEVLDTPAMRKARTERWVSPPMEPPEIDPVTGKIKPKESEAQLGVE